MDTQLTIALEIGLIDQKSLDFLEKEIDHESRLIAGLIKAIKRDSELR